MLALQRVTVMSDVMSGGEPKTCVLSLWQQWGEHYSLSANAIKGHRVGSKHRISVCREEILTCVQARMPAMKNALYSYDNLRGGGGEWASGDVMLSKRHTSFLNTCVPICIPTSSFCRILMQDCDALTDLVQRSCAISWHVSWHYKQSRLRCVAHGMTPSSLPGILDIWCTGFCLIDVIPFFHPHHVLIVPLSRVNVAGGIRPTRIIEALDQDRAFVPRYSDLQENKWCWFFLSPCSKPTLHHQLSYQYPWAAFRLQRETSSFRSVNFPTTAAFSQ